MRAWLIVSILVAVGLSGCATTNEPTPDNEVPASLDTGAIAADGAAIKILEEGAELVFEAVDLPFTHKFAVPEGATMVRFVADPLDANTIGVSMKNDDTGRRRCNQQPLVGFGQTLMGERSCSSITALDPAGTMWSGTASGSGTADVRIEFLTTPVDGVAGQLNLGNLSHAVHELTETQGFYISSHDGAQLWVEVTLPVGEGPWPTVIASSPYNGETGRLPTGTPAMWTYWTQDWAKRGYAAVNVDVRGYGKSGGCVEVWGENEQKDQAFIVDWVARQDWSDGNVGFYGQSYVGTTPVAAAVQAPEALKAIIAVAPVINSYEDWHYGGVPNGEGALSPVAYQVLTAAPGTPETQRSDIETFLLYATSGVCDPSLLPRANSPTAEYTEFHEERDFKLRVKNVEAAVLFTEGFEDANVKSAMIPGWFNELESEKLGVFGHWLHQHPARMDQEVLFLGWMDQYVKGKDIGFERIPDVVVNAETNMHRTGDAWPLIDAETVEFDVDGSVDLDPTGPDGLTITNGALVFQYPVENPLPMIAPSIELKGTLDGENGFVHADLYEVFADGGQRLLTWGRMNLALRDGYDNYQPLTPGQSFEATLEFRPTEHVIAGGSELLLVVRGVEVGESVGLAQPQPAIMHLNDSKLVIPTVDIAEYTEMPISAAP